VERAGGARGRDGGPTGRAGEDVAGAGATGAEGASGAAGAQKATGWNSAGAVERVAVLCGAGWPCGCGAPGE